MVFLSGCALTSIGVSSTANTPSTQEAAPLENDSTESDSDYVHQECSQEQILITVLYDHDWSWSPDGTEATGRLKGEAEGMCTLILFPSGDGNYEPDTCTIFYTQQGKVKAKVGSDECRVSGRGMAELTVGGSCVEGHLVVDILEVGTEDQEATMTCGPKTTDFVLFYPATALPLLDIDPIGIGIFRSDSTILPKFYDVNLYWRVTLQ
jgi:hypothetical protein